MKRAPKSLWILIALLCFAGILKATLPQVVIGTWTSAASLAQPRSNASVVMLSDGRILITGGDGASGPLQSAEFFGTDGTVSSAAAMNVARSRHFAVVLSDGRVLAGGGTTSGGGTTNSAEIYDPSADSWTQANPMTEARANATAALLQDGRVVIAGGDNSGSSSSTIEIYDPSSGNFAFAGTLSSPRTKHAMAVLADGRALIAGGFDGTNPLASSDVFDPSSGNVSAGPSLATPRFAHSATTLLDGTVLIVGGATSGSSGTVDLASAEVFDPTTGAFSTVDANLATARQGHQAFLLPNNSNVLIVGGTSGGAPVAASELFSPWQRTFAATGANVTARSSAAGSAMQQDGLLLAAGGGDASGNALASTELYAFPVVKTDASDYAPGSIVTITGSGWQPGETVTLSFLESPLIDTHPNLTAVADGNGNIVNNQFSPDSYDVNVRFYLTAVGSQSGLQAQNTFTDASLASATITIKDSACASNQTVFTVGATVCANVLVTTTGGGGAPNLFIEWFNPSGTLVQTTQKTGVLNNSTQTDTLPLTGTNAVAGTWTVQSCKNTGCSGGNLVDTKTFTVNPGPVSAATSSVSASPASVTADGSTTSNITATLKDASNNPVSGKIVSLTAGSGSSTITTISGTTNASGQATFTVKDATVESVTYTARDTTDSITISQTTTVSFVAGAVSAAASTVSASPASVTADGSTTSTITVTLKDANNHPVSGKTVTLSQGAGSSTISAASGASDAGGVVTFTVKDTKAETVTYTATDTTDSVTIAQTASVTFTAGAVSASTSTVSANPASVIADGVTTSIITVTLKDANNNPVSGKTVSLAQGTGSSTVSAASGLSSAAGVVTFTVKDTKAETVTYTATDSTDSIIITQTAAVTFTAGALHHFTFNNISSPQTAGTAFNITVTAEDANNNTVTAFNGNGFKAMLTSTGTLVGAPITTPSFTNGVLSNQSITITNTGTFTITATGVGGNSGISGTSNSFTVNPGAVSAGTSTVAANPTSVVADGSSISTITVTLTDANNNPVSGKTVSLTAGGGSSAIATISATTNASGQAGFTVKDTVIESVTYTAKDMTDNVTVTPTATVNFTVGPVNAGTSTLIANPTSVTADGTSTSTITVTLKDASSRPVSGKAVSLTAGSGSSIINTISGITNASGQATFTVQDTVPENVTYTGKDTTDNITITQTATVNFISPATTTQVVSSLNPSTFGQSVMFTATVTSLSGTPTGSVTFYDGSCGSTLLAGPTGLDGSGQAAFSISTLTAGSHTVFACYTPTGIYLASNGSVLQGVNQATPSINWSNPADITYGTPLSSTQLNATASVPGTFAYVPPAGTILNAGNGQTLSAVFTPSDPVDFATVSPSVQINVLKATPIIVWKNPADITYGTVLGNTQLNAIALPPASTLTGWWKGDGDYTDSVGGNTGTPQGGTAFTTGEVNQAFSFPDASGDGVTIPYKSGYDMNVPGFTASFWMQGSENGNGMETILEKSYPLDGSTGWAFQVDSANGHLQFDIGGSSFTQAASTANVLDGNFHYIVGTWDGATKMSLYVDGISQGPVTLTAPPVNNTGGLNVGFSSSGTPQYFQGAVDEVQIFGQPLPTGSYVYSPASGTVLNAGAGQTLSVTFSPTDTTDLNSANASVTINVTKANQVITFGALASKIYGDAPFTVSATGGGSSNPVTFTASPMSACTSSGPNGSTITITGAGLCAVTADQAGDSNYNPAPSALQSFTVNPKPITANLTAADKTYDGNSTDPDANMSCSLTGVLGTDTGNLSCAASSGTFNTSQVATANLVTATVTVSGSAACNYTLGAVGTNVSSTSATTTAHITTKAITATLIAADKTYDGTTTEPDASMSCALTGVLGSDSGNVSCAASSGTFDSKDVATASQATATVTISGSAAGNYTLGVAGTTTPSTGATATAHITTKPITATLMASDKTYDGNNAEPDPSMSCSLTGVLAADSVNVSCAATSGTFNSKDVATATQVTATVTISGTAAGNYTLGAAGTTTPSISVMAPAHITTKAITATLIATDKTYDGNTTEPDASMSCSLSGIVIGDMVNCAATSGTFNGANVGAHTVTATVTITGGSAGNYTLGAAGTTTPSTSATATANITTRPITATLTAADKTYDGNTTEPDASMTCSLTGVLAGDSANVTCTATSGTFNTSQVVSANLVTATVTIGGSAAGNYTLAAAGTTTSSTSATATAHITTKPITATLMAADKTYDGNNTEPNAMSCSLTGVLGTDSGNVSCTATSGTFNTSQVVSANLVTATVTISGSAAGDYTLGAAGTNLSSTSATATAHIIARPITVTPNTMQNKVYGTTPDPALIFTVGGSGLATGDTNATVFTGALARAAGENVGNYPIGQGTLLANSNYNLTFTSGVTFAITPAPLTITPDGGKTKTLGSVFSAFTGVVNGLKFSDAVTVTYTSAGAPAAAGVGSYDITVASYNFTTGMASNYTITTNTAVKGLAVLYATGGMCAGDVGHAIRQPINGSGVVSVFKMGSTVPTKFAVCDVNGVSIGTPGVVTGYGLVATAGSPSITVDEDTYSTTPDTAFRWDPIGLQWIFNQSTKNNGTLNKTGTIYYFAINLNDGSSIYFQYGLK